MSGLPSRTTRMIPGTRRRLTADKAIIVRSAVAVVDLGLNGVAEIAFTYRVASQREADRIIAAYHGGDEDIAARWLAKGMALGGATPNMPAGAGNTGRSLTNPFPTGDPLTGIPMLASGGIVTRPTLAMIGEAGSEAVIPLPASGSGLGNTYVFHFHGDINGYDEFEDRVVGAIENATQRGRLS